MAKSFSGSRISGHTPVENSPEEVDFPNVVTSEQQPPSDHSKSKTSPPDNGSESVRQARKMSRESRAFPLAPDTSDLRDIALASFGESPFRTESVQGIDDRQRIIETNIYPWSAHASLLITAADNSSWIGTGWFVGRRTLVTAGHVVCIKNSGVTGRDGWVKRIMVMPGRNGSTLPFGSVTSTELRSVSAWVDSGDENYDYGAIILPSDLGTSTGWLGFGVYTDAELMASEANISGYPGDKPEGTQWYDSASIASVNNRKVYYQTDTAGGQSGAAVYRTIGGGRYAFAVHAYGGSTSNSGTRIIKPVYDNIVLWNT